MIKVNKLNKFYNKGKSNEIHVINDTSLELPSKGLVTFLGHSGSGKTTLLNVIGGLDKFNNGNISYDDESFDKYKMSKIDKFRSRNIGYVFQNYNLLLEETVYDNLRIALDLIGVTDLEEQKKRIEYSLKAVGMFKYRKKIASFLSGGQQQRVSIARALIKKSKVIIADEPTGNLDSKNTIEVMNILKKISEQSLVLLVTHENDVANFYSDIIYEVKDGSIIGKKDVNSDVTFDSSKDDSTIYLKDLNETNFDTELGNVKIHSDIDEPLKINLDIIVKNGNIYLKSDKPIKLLEQANVKVVNDNYKEMKREDISEFDYDTSWYNDKKDDSKKLKKFAKRIKNSFISFRAVGKRQKFLYVCLAFIGIIMAASFSFLSFAVTVDNKSISYSKNINTIYRTVDNGSRSLNSIIREAYNADEITDIYEIQTATLRFNDQLVYSHYVSAEEGVKIAPDYEYNLELYLGERPKEKNDIVISADFASKIAKETEKELKDIIGLSLSKSDYSYYYDGRDSSKFNITGISKNDNKMAYLSLSGYLDYLNQEKNYYYINNIYSLDNKKTYINDSFGEGYELRSSIYEEYEIIIGNDVDVNSEEIQALVPDSFYKGVNQTLTINIDGEEKQITIVGKYKNSYSNSQRDKIIINKPVKYWTEPQSTKAIYPNSNEVKLIKGKYPTKANEVMVSIYYNPDIEIDSEIWVSSSNKKMKVVGVYNSDESNNYILYDISNGTLDASWLASGDVSFKVLNNDAFNERLTKDNLKIVTTEEFNIAKARADRKESVKEFLIVFAVTTAAAAVFVYFIMRSKMMSDIYNIGVYRSLGSSRMRINNKYLADIFILTTFTALIGYIIGTLGYVFISSLVNDAFKALGTQAIFVINHGIIVLGVLALYLIMNIFGMLPIIMLERKTPSEIIAKYDI